MNIVDWVEYSVRASFLECAINIMGSTKGCDINGPFNGDYITVDYDDGKKSVKIYLADMHPLGTGGVLVSFANSDPDGLCGVLVIPTYSKEDDEADDEN